MGGYGGRLEGQVAVITGGASGLGEAAVRLFVREGARVVIADVQDERAGRVVREIGGGAVYQRTDVTREEDVAAAVDRAVSELGRLDCMFANAGIVGAITATPSKTRTWRSAIWNAVPPRWVAPPDAISPISADQRNITKRFRT